MKEMKVRELIPPMWPPDSFTMEEARQALREVEADEARRTAKRKRSRAASKLLPQDGGEDP